MIDEKAREAAVAVAKEMVADRANHWEIADAVIEAYESAKQKGEAEGWRPIESAPKDGTEILLYGHGVLRSGGVYAKGRHVGWSQLARDGSIYWATRDPAVDCEPTAWRPLPEPPTMRGRMIDFCRNSS